MTEEKKKLSPFTLIAGAAASVTWMVVGSLFGAAGTVYGAALGSVTTTAGAFFYENAARKAHAKLQARKEQEKVDAHPDANPVQAQLGANLFPAREKRALLQWNRKRKLGFAAGMLALCMASAVASLFVIESATGQTLHSVLTNQKQYGTTFGGYSTQLPSKAPSVPKVTVSPVGSPDASPSHTASSTTAPSPSPSPSVSLIPSAAYTGVSQ